MAQMSIPYVITGPDGTRAVFNDSTDPDFVGYLDPDQGIIGLLDSADATDNSQQKVEGDGAVQGSNWQNGRLGTLQGMLGPEPDMLSVNSRETKLKRATRALRADCTLDWTPDGSGQRRLWLRRNQKVAITGRRPKQFLVGLRSRQSYALAPTESSLILPASGQSGETGFSSPITSPLTSQYNTQGQIFVVNQGDAPTWPRFVVVGPITNPRIRNNTTGQEIQFVANLLAGDTLAIDADLKTVTFNGANKYGAYQFVTSSWWQLQSGANDVRILAAAYATGAQVTIYWRHAYE